MSAPTTIDQYITSCPEQSQEYLRRIRAIVHEEAPEAEEYISYGVGAFRLTGYLVYFAGFKDHVSVYPVTTAVEALEETATYRTGKGTLQFKLDAKLPEAFIRKVVAARVQENTANT